MQGNNETILLSTIGHGVSTLAASPLTSFLPGIVAKESVKEGSEGGQGVTFADVYEELLPNERGSLGEKYKVACSKILQVGNGGWHRGPVKVGS